jgi:hypothetical protein
LTQESPKSELRLQRYGEKNFGDLFAISGKWLGVFLEIFLKTRGFLEICGLPVNCGKRQGPKRKGGWNIRFSNYFPIGNDMDSVHGSWTSIGHGPWWTNHHG